MFLSTLPNMVWQHFNYTHFTNSAKLFLVIQKKEEQKKADNKVALQ